ncbi:MAG: restriction endonuclease subunit S [Methylobacter sp.]
MSSEIRLKTRLSDCASFQEGYVNPSQKDQSYFGEDVKWLRATDLNDGFVFETSRRLSKKGFDSAGKSATLFEPGSLAISKSGTIGRIGILKDYMCGNRAVINIKPNKSCDFRFIFYTLLLNRAKIETLAEGSVQKNLYVSSLGNLEIELPSLEEQLNISSVLGALDDRIALLRETNTTLEAIAQALFKSWFVDFDPVYAKQQGREPEGMDAETAALFPDNFKESELGLAPSGWRAVPVGEVIKIVGGGTPNTKEAEYWEPAEFAWTTPKDLSGLQSPVLLKTERLLSAKGVSKVSSGLLPMGALLLSSRAPIGYLAIAQIPLAINQGYIAILPSSQLPPLYMYFWCKQNMEVIKSRSNGSTFMEISKKAFRPIPALVPPVELLAGFLDVANPIFARMAENEKQAQTLTTLRDTLLPRLISGQLRLPDAKALLEETTV